ncbi:MAG: hypothetical protein LBQ66_10370 [Planctomycetaceae bacterium]|nr:hypothetical protein [Planctomycetaceae bacterium]
MRYVETYRLTGLIIFMYNAACFVKIIKLCGGRRAGDVAVCSKLETNRTTKE